MHFYRKAVACDPNNFLLAADYAQSYYGFKPPKTGDEQADKKAELRHWNEALKAWNAAMALATDDVQREGVHVHLARAQINLGHFEEARRHLERVTSERFVYTKQALNKKMAGLEAAK